MRRLLRMGSGSAAAIAVLVASARAPNAIERKPLPVFTLDALDGRAVSSADVARAGKWLLIYVRPGCGPCDTLLDAIDPLVNPLVPARTVVVIGGVTPEGAAKLAVRFGDLKGAAWYADPQGAMAAALPLAGAPVVFGLNRTMIEWSLAGVVPDKAAVKSALVSWAGNK